LTDLASLAPVVVCLAAGHSQKPVIERARALGYVIIGVDRNVNAAASGLCDHMIHLSTHDPQPIIQALKKHPLASRIAGVLNRSSGPPVATAAAINESFNLPGVPLHRARQCLNKDLMRTECLRQDLYVVKHQTVASFSDLQTENLSYPCVMKPALSMVGKQGVVVVSQAEQMQAAFTQAQAASVSGKVLVEDYLPGHDVSVIALVNRGKLEILALLDEINQQLGDGTVEGKAMAVPSRFNTGPEADRIAALTQKVADVFELEHSALLMSCRISEGCEPRLIEIHLDMGGDKIMDVLLPAAGTFDVLQYMIKALTTECELSSRPTYNPTAVIFADGDDLISNRDHQILQAATTEELEQKVTECIGKVPRP